MYVALAPSNVPCGVDTVPLVMLVKAPQSKKQTYMV